jgi:hypothetical protein
MVKDWIMTACMEDLLSAPKGRVPPEDNIEVRQGGEWLRVMCMCAWLAPLDHQLAPNLDLELVMQQQQAYQGIWRV